MSRRRLTVTIAAGLVPVAAACAVAPVRAAGWELIDRVLAIVNGQVVTLSDARAALALGLSGPAGAAGAPSTVADAVSLLIDRRLILGEVARYQPPDPDEAALERRVRELLARLPAGVPTEAALAPLALDGDRLRRIAREDLQITAYLAQRFGLVQPSEEDVAAYYREYGTAFARGGAVPPLAEVAGEIRARLAAARQAELVARWVADLRRRAEIVVLDPGGLATGTGRS